MGTGADPAPGGSPARERSSRLSGRRPQLSVAADTGRGRHRPRHLRRLDSAGERHRPTRARRCVAGGSTCCGCCRSASWLSSVRSPWPRACAVSLRYRTSSSVTPGPSSRRDPTRRRASPPGRDGSTSSTCSSWSSSSARACRSSPTTRGCIGPGTPRPARTGFGSRSRCRLTRCGRPSRTRSAFRARSVSRGFATRSAWRAGGTSASTRSGCSTA